MKIRRLFWKLFFSFWLGNALMLGGVTVFVIATLESSHMQERHRQLCETIASVVIEEYELGTNVGSRSWQRALRHNPMFREFKHHFSMRIINELDEEIFNIRFRHHEKDLSSKSLVSFSVSSDNNNSYRVETFKRPAPPFIREAMRRFNVLQIFAVLISSALVAVFLSWHLSRPLVALRQFSKTYSGSESKQGIGVRLLARGDEIGDLARELNTMSERVQKNFANQKELLHYVSHELRAPLARLQTVAGLAEQRVPESKDFMEKIHQECANINELIERILQYSRLEHVALSVSSVCVGELMNDVVELLGRSYPESNIELRMSQSVAETRVSMDENRMVHALENVVQNACKYGAQGKPVIVSAEKMINMLTFSVENDGEPIAAEVLSKIFDPFYRADNRMHTDGHGLGLSIAKRAIEQHHGVIQALARPLGGLKVTISIPLQ